MALRRRLRKALFWGMVLVLSVTAGSLIFAYSYVTDSATLAALVRREAPTFLPGSRVRVDRVRVRPLLGQVTLNHVDLAQPIGRRWFPTGQVAWLNIKHDLRAMLKGHFQPREIVVAQPVLRVGRRPDGTWNLQGLLADPWPGPPLAADPRLLINNGTLELIDGASGRPVKVLRDVFVRAEPTGAVGTLRFEATARGGPFDRLRLEGTIAYTAGRIELTRAELTGLVLSEAFGRCLPAEARAAFRRQGLTTGEVDVALKHLTFDLADPTAARYAGSVRLRGGTLERPELPDTLTQVQAAAAIDNGTIAIERAEGRNGKTVVQVQGRLSAERPEAGPMDLSVEVIDLELDERLRAKTPPEYAALWHEYRPHGWVDLAARLVRPGAGAPARFGLTVGCKDVGMTFHLFPYPVQHARGTLVWEGPTIRVVDMRTIIGGAWLTAAGTIDQPGPEAVVKLDFASESFPIDETLRKALPEDIRQVVDDFHPTGSVRGTAHLLRRPPPGPGAPDDVQIRAALDLNPGCTVRWSGLPYQVRELIGHLDLASDRWVFTGMRGTNGTAVLAGDGEVVQARPGQPAVRLKLKAEHLPFDQQLRDALPPEWQATWTTLNPSGFSRVEADIRNDAGQPPHYHLRIVPEREETRIRLVLAPIGPGPLRLIQLPPMENVTGTFTFDDGTVTMADVAFRFREAPVGFKGGTVVLQNTRQFHLAVEDLLVEKLRLDAELRKIMPPVMAQFAQRLDDGKTFWVRAGKLAIGWSGRAGEPARVDWRDATVVFDGNAVQTGLPLEQIQGQVEQVSGWSDGQTIAVGGLVNLESIRLLGQQVTRLRSPVVVQDGWARFGRVEGRLLGGALWGTIAVSLDATPRFRAALELREANLAQFTRTIPGRQSLRGLVSGRIELTGEGNDLRTLSGNGAARVRQGDLGQLPLALRWAKVPNFQRPTKTAFDAVELGLLVRNGDVLLDPVKFSGDAISLTGSGTLQLQGDRQLDVRLSPVYGRDERHLPILGPMMREATGQLFDLHVTGPLASPTVKPEPLPDVLTRASRAARRLAERRPPPRPRRDAVSGIRATRD